jgi:hypothetical protein
VAFGVSVFLSEPFGGDQFFPIHSVRIRCPVCLQRSANVRNSFQHCKFFRLFRVAKAVVSSLFRLCRNHLHSFSFAVELQQGGKL